MTEIKNNYTNYTESMPQGILLSKEALKYKVEMDRANRPPRCANDEFVHQHKRNGLVERLYNKIKNLTGLGIGSKKVQSELAKVESGEITDEQAKETVNQYRKSQVNAAQGFGDLMSIGASGFTFFKLRKLLKEKGAEALLNEKYYAQSDILHPMKIAHKKFLKIGKSNVRLTAYAVIPAIIAGGVAKWGSMLINRIGSKDVDKKDFRGAKTPYDKMDYKIEKKNAKKEHGRNFLSGALNGLMMPLTLIGGGIVGVPAYIIGNSLNRYFVANKTEKDKSFNGYLENIKSDSITHTVIATAAAIPMIKTAQYHKVFDKNLKTATDKLLKANLKPSEYGGKTSYQELSEILLDSESVQRIIHNSSEDVNKQINALTKENLFAVKFKQISNDGSPLATALKENCPSTRTKEEAQSFINNNLGSGYQIKKLLGVGTVAETYLATAPDGKEVCLKVLKEGINADKIRADKTKFEEIIKNLSNKTADEKDYLLKNLDDMAEGLLNEVNFETEMKAAQKLAKHTKVAKVVHPIEVKNGVYVMERAKGISLSSLIELNSAKNYKELLEKEAFMTDAFKPSSDTPLGKLLKDVKTKEEQLKIVNDYIKRIEDRTPEFGDISLTLEQFRTLLAEYQQVLVEQFNKVEKNGKTLHADIHPGNIFIDINALRNRKENVIDQLRAQMGNRKSSQIFTLIDTGNAITLSPEQAMRSINLTSYIKNGNVKDIADFVLDGAVLGNKTKEEATKIITEELNKCFFGTELRLSKVTNESLLQLTSNIMRKHGIIPNDTQMTLQKARKSADNSRSELSNSLLWILLKDIKRISIPEFTKLIAKVAKESIIFEKKYKNMQAFQEKLNLKELSLAEQLKHKKNPNMLKTNSEDHLTYKLKQKMEFADKRKIM